MAEPPRPTAPYTHGHHESVLRAHRWRTVENSAAYLLPYLTPGRSVLDVGCGPGTITVDMAGRVAPGEVIGIDPSVDVIDSARAAAGARFPTGSGPRFEVGDVAELPWEDDSFDVVHAHQVLQHLADPVAALQEMRRVCRPSGVVAARDADYEAMTWFPDDPGLDAWLDLYRRVARSNGAEPDAGRRLVSWARAAGFTEVVPGASAWCYSSTEDRIWWGELWAQRVTESAFGHQAVTSGLATWADLQEMAAAWRRWAGSVDGWFAVLHGEILATP